MKIPNPRAYSVCFAGDPANFDHVIEALGGEVVGCLPWFCAGGLLVVLPDTVQLKVGRLEAGNRSCRITEIQEF